MRHSFKISPLWVGIFLSSAGCLVLAGWLFFQLQQTRSGLPPDASFKLPLIFESVVFILSAFILVCSVVLYRMDLRRQETEQALRLAEERTRLIIDTAHDAFIAMNAEGKVIDWNRQAEITFGWKRTEILGKPMADLIIPLKYREAHQKGLKHFLTTGKGPVLNKRIEISAIHREGREFPIELTISPIPKGDTFIFNAFLHDISERKQSEQTILEKTAELARSKTELEQLELFAFSATHDLREPLHKIIALGDLLSMHNASRLDQEGKDDLERIRHTAKRMAQMFEQLRELSRITTDISTFEAVDLKAIVQEVISDLDVRIKEAAASIEMGELPTVQAYKTQMRQLFQNLIANALKFRQKKGSSRIVIKGRILDQEFAEITVEDNGVGFDEKYKDQLFKPFHKLHPAGEYEGSGIGLAICQKIVLHHGGKITAESKLGKGTIIQFTLSRV